MNNKQSFDRPIVILFTIFMVSFALVNCNMNEGEGTQKSGEGHSINRLVSENTQAQTDTELSTPSAVSTEQMHVYIDPVTGEIRPPTNQESEALNKSISQRQSEKADEPQQPVVYPDGTISIQLNESYLEHTIVKVCADGSLLTDCSSVEERE